MEEYKLDYSKAVEMQISYDAFLYLTEEEYPLDENNLEEAKEIMAMFPYGFIVKDDWKLTGYLDFVQCTFVPYAKNKCDSSDYDDYENITNHLQLQIKYLNDSYIKVFWCNIKTGARELRGEYKLYMNKHGHKYFQTKEGSTFFLKHLKNKNE